jgi:hypothetical protein
VGLAIRQVNAGDVATREVWQELLVIQRRNRFVADHDTIGTTNELRKIEATTQQVEATTQQAAANDNRVAAIT